MWAVRARISGHVDESSGLEWGQREDQFDSRSKEPVCCACLWCRSAGCPEVEVDPRPGTLSHRIHSLTHHQLASLRDGDSPPAPFLDVDIIALLRICRPGPVRRRNSHGRTLAGCFVRFTLAKLGATSWREFRGQGHTACRDLICNHDSNMPPGSRGLSGSDIKAC